jgi:hypothetical protein
MKENNKYYYGGDFLLDKSFFFSKTSNLNNNLKNYKFSKNSRSIFYQILKSIYASDKNILIPSYLCEDVLLKAITRSNFKYKIFKVNKNLEYDFNSINSLIDKNTNSILIINYFGIVDHISLIKKIKKKFKNINIIYDVVQNPWFFLTKKNFFFSKKINHSLIDFIFTSFKKSFPVPEGALMHSKKFNHDFIKKSSKFNYVNWHTASKIKKKFLINKSEILLEKNYLNIYEKIYKKQNITNEALYGQSKKMLTRIDYASIAKIRITNYNFVYNLLLNNKKILIFKLPNGNIPFFFPVFLKNQGSYRDSVLSALKELKIFCPVHWSLGNYFRKQLTKDGTFFYDNEISIPIDHRFNKVNLQILVNKLLIILNNFK